MTFDDRAFLVGPRYAHHSTHSGYEGFGRYCGRELRAPVKSRFLAERLGQYPWIGDLGKRIDQLVTKVSRRPLYTAGMFLIEMGAAWHMLGHRRSLYHVLYGDTDFWLLGYVSRLTGHRLVATFHEPDYALEWLAIDKIATRLDAVILVSESQRAYFEAFLPPERVFVIPHGVDTEFFRPAEKLSDQPVGVTVGSHHRDPETLSKALDTIFGKNPTAVMKAVGARRKGGGNFILDDQRVTFYEGVSDEELRSIYQSATVAVYSLRQATANNAMLEAMACGIPIVATEVGGVAECVGEEAAIICPRWDHQALAAAVLRVLEDRALAQRMSQAARARALQYDYRVAATRTRDVYEKVLAGGRGRTAQ